MSSVTYALSVIHRSLSATSTQSLVFVVGDCLFPLNCFLTAHSSVGVVARGVRFPVHRYLIWKNVPVNSQMLMNGSNEKCSVNFSNEIVVSCFIHTFPAILLSPRAVPCLEALGRAFWGLAFSVRVYRLPVYISFVRRSIDCQFSSWGPVSSKDECSRCGGMSFRINATSHWRKVKTCRSRESAVLVQV